MYIYICIYIYYHFREHHGSSQWVYISIATWMVNPTWERHRGVHGPRVAGHRPVAAELPGHEKSWDTGNILGIYWEYTGNGLGMD